MTAVVSRGRVAGFDAVTLENRWLRAVIVPALGGRVWELEDRVRRRQWIWHRDVVPLKASHVGEAYDDVWAGGWEELFPNDAPGTFEGRELPDHGEWWARSWSTADSSTDGAARLRLSSSCSVVRASCSKEFVLSDDSPSLTVHYRIHSEEADAFHFLFKQHLPVQLTGDCRLLLPGGKMQAVDPSFGTMLPGAGPFEWPFAADGAGRSVDMRVVPAPSSAACEFLYVSGLPDGWCGVADLEREASLRMSFDRQVLPFVWLFLSYGGWRRTHTAVLEPCSNMPKDLAEAVRSGQSARLQPGEEFRTTVSVTVGDLAGLAECLASLGVVPARMGSSRFPGKPLAPLCGRPMIEHVYRSAAACAALDDVVLATCDDEIASVAKGFGAHVVMTSAAHERASDRVAEAASSDAADIVVMIQGDEPMIRPEMISAAVAPLLSDRSILCTNLAADVLSEEEFVDPNTIKIVMSRDGRALYFSRQPIPTRVGGTFAGGDWLKQVCVIGFTHDGLRQVSRAPAWTTREGRVDRHASLPGARRPGSRGAD